jgi:hypothetical protein
MTGRGVAPLGRSWRSMSGGRVQGDAMSERLQLLDEVAGSAVGVDALGVVVGAEVGEPCGGVGEEVPDDDEDRAGGGDDCSQLASAPDQAPVARTQEGVGLVCRAESGQ